MVKTYESLRDQYGNWISGLTKLFVITTLQDGSISRFESGISVPSEACTLFIVDDWLISQIDKLLFIDGELIVKDGETIDEPAKTQKQFMMEELERQMAELAATPDEVLDGVEESEVEETPVEEVSTEGE